MAFTNAIRKSPHEFVRNIITINSDLHCLDGFRRVFGFEN